MLFTSAVLAALVLQASAFPFVLDEVKTKSLKRQDLPGTGTAAEIELSEGRTNCGPTACTIFDAEDQYVSTTGDYAWASPAADQIRGPCPGLNAAANHGYLPRSGVATIADTVDGLGAAYGMSPVLAAGLAAIAIILDGDPVSGTWSIGGPPSDDLLSGILGEATGISYSHDNYENDASIARGDAYINGGDAHSLIPSRFADAYAASNSDGEYTLDLFAQNYQSKAAESIATNPYAFWGAFSGLVAPAAYNFVINFMSNHTAENPSGYLNGDMFKTFFAVTGDYPDFTWLPGQERIPDNWYRRPTSQPYTLPDVFLDLGIQFLAYPDSFYLGGNTGTTDSFVGVELGNLTGGVYDASTLFEGNNLACFFFQAAKEAVPDSSTLVLATADAVLSLLDDYLSPVLAELSCPELEKYDVDIFEQFPGYSYHPLGPAQNYKE